MHPTLSKLLRELQLKIESLDQKFDVMDKKLNKIKKQEVKTNSQLDGMALVQRMGDETLRKAANSINVLVRLVSGLTDISPTDLVSVLVEANALVANVPLNPDLNLEPIELTEHSPMHRLKLMLTELIQIIDKQNLDNDDKKSDIIPITTASSCIPSASCSTANTAASSQNKSSAVIPVTTEGTSVIPTESSQNNSSTVVPVTSEVTSMMSAESSQNNGSAVSPVIVKNTGIVSTNPNPLPQSALSSEVKEREAALRRKYKNKYRYMDLKKTIVTKHAPPKELKNNVVFSTRNMDYIPEPYRDAIFHNVSKVKFVNCETNKSVVKPLSFIHPRVIIKPCDIAIANCASVAPRVKKNNENGLQRRNLLNTSDKNDGSNCKRNTKRNLRSNSKITKAKNIKRKNQATTSNSKTKRSATKDTANGIICDLHLKTKVILQ